MRINTLNPLNRNWGPNNGLVMRLLTLPHNSGGRQWFDIAGNSHGVLTSGPTWASNRRDGSLGGVKFDGTDDYVEVSSLPTVTDGLTWCLWSKLTANTSFPMMITAAGGGYWELRYEGGGNLNPGVYWNGASAVSSSAVSLNSWNHIGVTVLSAGVADAVKLYVNGVQVAYNSGAFYSPTAIRLGQRYAGGFNFTGTMDDVCMWNRAISATEIQAIYNDSRTGYSKSLNWIKPRVVTPAVASTNRIRRLVTAGGS